MTGHGTKFGRKKEEVIVALLTTRTVEEAARVVNISPRTLLRWQKEPEFDLALRAAKRAVRAADSILNHTIKAIENEEIEARVSALERAAEAAARRSP